jgi:hypothetical protein
MLASLTLIIAQRPHPFTPRLDSLTACTMRASVWSGWSSVASGGRLSNSKTLQLCTICSRSDPMQNNTTAVKIKIEDTELILLELEYVLVLCSSTCTNLWFYLLVLCHSASLSRSICVLLVARDRCGACVGGPL